MIGTEHFFHYPGNDRHSKTRDLFYKKCKRYDELVSGVMMSVDISDQFNHTKLLPKKVTYRTIDNIN